MGRLGDEEGRGRCGVRGDENGFGAGSGSVCKKSQIAIVKFQGSHLGFWSVRIPERARVARGDGEGTGEQGARCPSLQRHRLGLRRGGDPSE